LGNGRRPGSSRARGRGGGRSRGATGSSRQTAPAHRARQSRAASRGPAANGAGSRARLRWRAVRAQPLVANLPRRRHRDHERNSGKHQWAESGMDVIKKEEERPAEHSPIVEKILSAPAKASEHAAAQDGNAIEVALREQLVGVLDSPAPQWLLDLNAKTARWE